MNCAVALIPFLGPAFELDNSRKKYFKYFKYTRVCVYTYTKCISLSGVCCGDRGSAVLLHFALINLIDVCAMRVM